jgi:hypothetical protein
MNLDRALAILGVAIGLLGVAIGVYVSQKDHSMGLLLASGWVAAALIGATICTLAFCAITAMEKAHSAGITALEKARGEAYERATVLSNDAKALQVEVAEYKNISRALSAVIGKEDKPKAPRSRAKRPAPQVPHEGEGAN